MEVIKNIVHEAYVSLGSNMGERLNNVNVAIKALSNLCGTKLIKVSNMYITNPLDTPDKQNMYVNCCVKLETTLSAHALLGAFLGIESAMGKIRTFKNASRIIDIDLLLYDDIKTNTEELILPHPRMMERLFVLKPLSEISDLPFLK